MRILRSCKEKFAYFTQIRVFFIKIYSRLLRILRYNAAMTPKEIDEWLKKKGKSRDWLAEQLSVSPNTARGWFSCRPIPKLKMEKILSMMKEEERDLRQEVETSKENRNRVRGTSFTDLDMEELKRSAEMLGISEEEFLYVAAKEKIRLLLGDNE